jgi:hypothetical protein
VDPGEISGHRAAGDDGGGPAGPVADSGLLPEVSNFPGSNTPSVLSDGSECFEGTYTPFWGDLHAHLRNHTKPITCSHTAQELLATGKERGLNFIHVTEHVWRLTAGELADCKEAAAAASTDTFRPGCGFETNVVMADGSYSGHANSLFAPSNHNADTSDAVGEDFFGVGGKRDFYTFVGDSSGLGQINHPNHDEDGWPDRAAAYVDESVAVVELSGSCGGCADRDAAAITTFLAMLDAGWHIGPSMNSDTHCLTPGRRTGLWVVPDDQPVRAALEGRRTFVQSREPTGAVNNELSFVMRKVTNDETTHECWMGSRLARPAGDEAAVRISLRGPMVTDGTSGSITMKVFARGSGFANPLASAVCEPGAACTCDSDVCTWEIAGVPIADTDWLVAYAESSIADEVGWALTAPVWLF